MSTRDALAPVRGARTTQPSDRPRLALRFEAGRGIVALAQPLAFEGGAVTQLETDLGRLPSPVDLRAGASRFRHRRSRALHVEVRVDLDELARALCRDGLELRVLGAGAAGIDLALRDPIRTIALALIPAWDGDDLLLVVRGARAAVDGPRTAMGDALAILRELGAPLDHDRGVLRVADPLRRALGEALLPHGWRLPELRGLGRAIPRVEGRTLVLRASSPAQGDVALPPSVRAALEDARALAPLTLALANDRDARRVGLELAARAGALRPADLDGLAAELALLDGGAPSGVELGEDARASALRMRDAIHRRDEEAVARHARALADTERCDELAIEALRAASALLRARDPVVAADLSARALARRPRDAELALEWLERAALAPEGAPLVTSIRALRATIAGPLRADVLRGAAALLDRAGEHEEAQRTWEEASRLAPDDPIALEGLASALAREGRVDEALSTWDRAVARHRDPDAAARALLRAAESARDAGHPQGAAARLESAASRARSDELRAEAWALLAALRRETGAPEAAIDAEASLFELAERVTSTFVVSGLFAAARAAIAEDAAARARGALGALRRSGAPEPEIRMLEHDLDARELAALDREAPEAGADDPAQRALRARAIAERLRGSGRLGDAARALARAGAITRDAATLRAALELAEKAEAWDAALEVIDRAIEVVGGGPARAALEARRDAIRARRPL